MLKELLVKQDVVDERVTAFDLDALDIESVTVCGLVDVPHKAKDKIELDSRIATLAIGADGACTMPHIRQRMVPRTRWSSIC